MGKEIKVGMADLNVCVSPDSITTLGLGSCVGIALRDPITKIGGLAHIMLPDSTTIRNNSNIPKFADTGIEELVKQVVRRGADRNRLVAKIAGGAQMFGFQSKSEMVRVGERNVEATKKKTGAASDSDSGGRYRKEFWKDCYFLSGDRGFCDSCGREGGV